jgi:putative lipoic acid-binding regulatory protein
MSNSEDSKAFYSKLKDELEKSTSWPSSYLYKFIITSDKDKIDQVETIFDNTGAVINTKKSSNGKYTSISIMVNMKDADAVIEKYIEVGKVEGVISL